MFWNRSMPQPSGERLNSDGAMEVLRDGIRVHVRRVRKEDTDLEREFIEGLSPESRRSRFLASISSPSDSLLKGLTDLDESKEAAFIALLTEAGKEHEVGVARFSADPGGSAEIAVAVDDHWQAKGLATLLMRHLIELARERGVERLYSVDFASNHKMHELMAHLGFTSHPDPTDATLLVHSLDLRSSPP